MGEARLVKLPRVWNTSNDSKRKRGTEDHRISVCTDCRHGIFEGHEYMWTNRGLVHTTCNEEKVKRKHETFADEGALP